MEQKKTPENPIPIHRVLNNQKEPSKPTYVRPSVRNGWPQRERMRGNQLQMQRLQKGDVGHLQKDFCSKRKGAESNFNQNRQRHRPSKKRLDKVRGVRTWLNESSEDDEKEPVMSFNNADRSILVKLNGRKTEMIVDTGCKYNIKYRQHCTEVRNLRTLNCLLQANASVTAYRQNELALQCKGYFNGV